MLLNGMSGLNLGSQLPVDLKGLPTLQGMVGGMTPPPPTEDPKIKLEQDTLRRFGNWTGQTDTKVMAADLKKRGLIGAQQLIDDQPNVNSASSIRNAQSDWKVNAIQEILANAKRYGLRTRAQVMANKDLLLNKPEWKDAINNDSFKSVHPNFWNIITDSILPEQYKKFDAEKSLAKK